ncbi:PQQ-dependent sugar dehydrogenase [Gracilimonas mengyeensis]|uniref:Por secretion system C-terminal sorting domain-containing protein n=1 Tax=Gracilimonas mengyeensis TaxID=1302730 RepID=A0A521DDQ5_9BACT|nr:PQQ-dependent sugar dehydrogenase [Gracilimonas mengyeensis]SMO69934.1 Por secretion system C-terminal sorting domain-containing protein [Gracilimonas mengyeensis]
MKRLYYFLFVVIFALISVNASAQFEVVNAYPNLSFNAPIDYQYAMESDSRVFVAERSGQIVFFENSSGASETTEFLDISDQVETTGEGGLLGFAFHPDYENNLYVYVYYTAADPFRSVVSRFEVPEAGGAADEGTEQVLLEVDQPYTNHNAGQIRFGPDGYLYIALGDGGSGGDPEDNGEDRTTLLGSILRIDVDETEGDLNYGIPADNPFVDNSEGYREEIYAYGLRNPYRFSFDAETGELWVGDVGQSTREEIDVVEKGLNYGWNTMEGSLCYEPSDGCETEGRELPVYEYGRSEGGSITGGFVYRGEDIPDLYGRYVYGDFVSGNLWSLAWDGETASDNQLIDNLGGGLLIMFGEDQNQELYFGGFDGNIYTFESLATSTEQNSQGPNAIKLQQNYPNPFNPSTEITYQLPNVAEVDLRVYNMLGQEVAVLANGQRQAGPHTVRFDGAGLSSGLYIYRLRAGQTALTRKMTLMK